MTTCTYFECLDRHNHPKLAVCVDGIFFARCVCLRERERERNSVMMSRRRYTGFDAEYSADHQVPQHVISLHSLTAEGSGDHNNNGNDNHQDSDDVASDHTRTQLDNANSTDRKSGGVDTKKQAMSGTSPFDVCVGEAQEQLQRGHSHVSSLASFVTRLGTPKDSHALRQNLYV
jgi:hypothetical protein